MFKKILSVWECLCYNGIFPITGKQIQSIDQECIFAIAMQESIIVNTLYCNAFGDWDFTFKISEVYVLRGESSMLWYSYCSTSFHLRHRASMDGTHVMMIEVINIHHNHSKAPSLEEIC